MTAQVYLFEDLRLPPYNALTHLGTAGAMTSFLQLTGGGYFDNYGAADSPHAMRDILYSCWIVSPVAATNRVTLDALRRYVGVRGKLTAEYDDGTLRWQLARMVDVDTPDDVKQVAWLPVDMRFVPALQHWNGIIQGTGDWVWGDGSWRWGDGTHVMGQTSTLVTMTSTGATPANLPTVTVAGNKAPVNLQLLVTAVTNTITVLTLESVTNGTKFTYIPITPASIGVGEHFLLDTGTLAAYHLTANKTATAFVQSGTATTATATAHGYSTTNLVRIKGTNFNDGFYTVTATTTNTFTYTNKFGRTETPLVPATCNKATNVYGQVTLGVRGDWFRLDPGNNTISATVTGNAAQDATVLFEYYERYA